MSDNKLICPQNQHFRFNQTVYSQHQRQEVESRIHTSTFFEATASHRFQLLAYNTVGKVTFVREILSHPRQIIICLGCYKFCRADNLVKFAEAAKVQMFVFICLSVCRSRVVRVLKRSRLVSISPAHDTTSKAHDNDITSKAPDASGEKASILTSRIYDGHARFLFKYLGRQPTAVNHATCRLYQRVGILLLACKGVVIRMTRLPVH
jgi:hypothetical protein